MKNLTEDDKKKAVVAVFILLGCEYILYKLLENGNNRE